VKGTGKGKGRKDGKGNGKATKDEKGKGKDKGREKVKGTVLINEPQGEMISRLQLLCSCRRKCQRQTWTQRAN